MRTLLIVEDDFHIQDIYRMSFTKTGQYAVETASDGQEALVKLSKNTYDIILLDIMLPKVTGIDVLRAARSPNSSAKNTPIILITNLGQDDIIKEAFRIGADGYLIKAQFTPQDVVREVDAFFDQISETAVQPSPQPVTSASPVAPSPPTPTPPIDQPTSSNLPPSSPPETSDTSNPVTAPGTKPPLTENPQQTSANS